MASISKRRTASGEARYDVRYRAGGRAVEESFKRRQDAENRLRQLEAEKLRGPVADPRRGRELLADFARRWLSARLVRGRPLAAMTKQGYLGLLRRNIDPTIGRYRLAEITPSVVRAWYAEVAACAGGDQAAKSYRLLRAIMNSAVDDELIVRNPCRIRGGGTERADERPMIDAALVFRLADSISDRLRALVILAGFVGLRTGELLGLRRCDVELGKRRLTVLVQAQQVVGMGRIVTGPKSEAGQRTVSLPNVAVEALEKHLASYGQPGESAVLFTGPRGEPITRALLSKEWQAARASAGVPDGLRIHDLRHHAATLTARMPGITTKELMARIGHASPRAALIYQHATEQRTARSRPTSTERSRCPTSDPRASEGRTVATTTRSSDERGLSTWGRSLVSTSGPGGQTMPTPRLFPRRTLEQALRVPLALRENNGGNPWKSAEVAKALGLGPSTGNFFYVTAASRDYGLTEGTRDTAQISLLPLGRRAVYPASADDEKSALLEAFLAVDVFRGVLEHFGGNKLPERRFLTNILRETFSIPEDQHDEFVDVFTKNCRFLGIGADYKANGSGRPPATRDRTDGSSGDTVTVAAPEDAEDAPVCFIVMPFTERDEAHETGFFDEVLDNLFTPAITNAGFKATTAKRHGSDVIQSTIVNDLLDADLVLVDLTEHNPNVLFELGMRITEEKPVALVRARGTGPIFDVDHLLRVVDYSPNLWPSTVAVDVPKITDHIKGAWDARANPQTFMKILRQRS